VQREENHSAEPDSLAEALFGCLQAVEAGETLEDLQARYPQFAAQIAEFFTDRNRFEHLAAPLRQVTCAASTPPATAERLVHGDGMSEEDSLADTLGDFRLLREVGRGGMGIVYEAEQMSLNRRVALKVIRAGEWASPEEVQRFRNEAETVALLDHPHIVPVYEVGEQDGQVYFSMKLIVGGGLAEHLGAFTGVPRTAAQLVAQVARAVHHAHQRGVLHRDLKPANILLDAEGRPHVTDFGLARRLETDSSLSQSGTIVGTPGYVPPEQTSGKKGAVTTVADVYGLGAVLYALLTGRPPFRADNVLDTLVQVREKEPESPSRLNPKVDRDLETICLKCLDKDPTRRYGSARELAEDLDRWLKGEPIQARPLGWAARLWRWCRRNPVVASLTAAAVVLLGTVAAGLTSGLIILSAKEGELREALDQAQGQEREAGRQQKRAEEYLETAYQVLDEIYLDLAENRLPRGPEIGPEDRRLLEKTLTFYEHFARQNSTDLRVREKTAKAYLRVGAIQDKLGEYQKANAAYRQAVAAWDKLVAEFPDRPEYRLQLARSYASLAWVGGVSVAQGPEAEKALGKALALQEQMAKASPGQVEYQHDLALTHAHLGIILLKSQQFRQAEEAMGRAIAIREKLAEENPRVFLYREELGESLGNLGMLLTEAGRLGEAEEVLRRNLKFRQKLAEDVPGSPQARHFLADAYQDMSRVLMQTGRLQEALEGFRLELALREKLVAELPGVREYQNRLLTTRSNLYANHHNLGNALRKKGQLDEAIAEYQEALHFNKDNHLAHNNLGNALADKGRLDEAIAEYQEAIRIKKDLSGAHYNLGNALRKKGELDKAIAEFREAIRIKKDYAEAHCNLGHALLDQGKFVDALAALKRGHELGSANPRWPYPSAKWVQQCEHLARLDGQLPVILKGEGQPRDAAERRALAFICGTPARKLYGAAARFYAEAFAAEPKLADDLQQQHRYNAARAAALAGSGQGKDADQIDDKERARLRRQALDWLQADLAAWQKQLAKNPDKVRPVVLKMLLHWQQDRGFAGVRGQEALAQLPETERQQWQKLWQEVEELRKTAAGP
jgi:serine/threonine-protein kinase